jgi:hypothetical protein
MDAYEVERRFKNTFYKYQSIFDERFFFARRNKLILLFL